MTETFSGKCYVMVCGGCNCLFDAQRDDQLTCSSACRVKAHRNGSLKALRALAESFEIKPGQILQAAAIDRLGMGDLVMSGNLKLNGDSRVSAALNRLVFRLVREGRAES